MSSELYERLHVHVCVFLHTRVFEYLKKKKKKKRRGEERKMALAGHLVRLGQLLRPAALRLPTSVSMQV